MVRYESSDVNPDMSMLEALDVLNEELIREGRRAGRRSSTIAAKASADPADS